MPEKPTHIPISSSFETAERAQILASVLRLYGAIPATVRRLVTDSGPTNWWHVWVSARHESKATALYKVWAAAYAYGRADMRAALQGEPFDRALSYMTVDAELIALLAPKAPL